MRSIRRGDGSPRVLTRPLRCATLSSFALAVLLGMASCGGDDGLSRAEFVERADAICAAANEKEQVLGLGGPGWHYGPNFGNAESLSEFNEIGRSALEQLRSLTPPAEDRDAVEAVLSSIERSVAVLDAQVAAVRAGRRGEEAANVREYESAYGDLAAAAASMGLSQCQGISV